MDLEKEQIVEINLVFLNLNQDLLKNIRYKKNLTGRRVRFFLNKSEIYFLVDINRFNCYK